jgi:RNA polymerase sigma-70 factor (ECF subfamily)
MILMSVSGSQSGAGKDPVRSATNSAPTRWSLIGRLKEVGDDDSWREFADAYGPLIHTVALRSGLNDADAEEVAQEVLLAVARRMPEFKCDPAAGSFKSWLLTLTRWRIIDQVRKRERTSVEGGPPSAAKEPPRPGPDDSANTATIERIADPHRPELAIVWDEEWEKHLLETATDRVKQRVDPELYQLFDFHVLRGWPAAKVARKVGVSLPRVYFAKYRVSALVKREIEAMKLVLS